MQQVFVMLVQLAVYWHGQDGTAVPSWPARAAWHSVHTS